MIDRGASAPEGDRATLLTRPFLLLCTAMLLGYANQWIVMPVIPLYVTSQGGSALLAGLALLAFSVPSVAVRPFIGMLADRWNAAAVLGVGLMLLAGGSALLLVPGAAMLFVGSVVRGLGWAGVNTGGYTRLATAAPPERRGEAAGYYSAATSTASTIFPAIGLWMLNHELGYSLVFGASIVLAVVGLPFAYRLASDGLAIQAAQTRPTQPQAGPILDRGVLIATVLNLCSTLAMPSVMAFLPLYARSLGIANIGLFYVIAGATNILLRPLLGKWSDAMGRAPGVAIGLGAQCAGIVLILAAQNLAVILAGGVFVAAGMALTTSTTTALAMDLANPRSRGQAMATYSISYQIGAGFGAIIAGALADLAGLRAMYVGSLIITGSGLVLLAATRHRIPARPEASTNP